MAASPAKSRTDKYSGTFFFYGNGPLQLIAKLKDWPWVVVREAPKDWATREDIDELMKLIRSDEECGFICSYDSSWMPTNHRQSTIGVEARFILYGISKGLFPFKLDSRKMEFSAEDAEKWYHDDIVEGKRS